MLCGNTLKQRTDFHRFELTTTQDSALKNPMTQPNAWTPAEAHSTADLLHSLSPSSHRLGRLETSPP